MSDWEFEYFEERFTEMWGENVGRYLANEFHRMTEGCDCIDNYRYAKKDTIQMEEYNRQMKNGCCGSVDRGFMCEGQSFILGFNYGH